MNPATEAGFKKPVRAAKAYIGIASNSPGDLESACRKRHRQCPPPPPRPPFTLLIRNTTGTISIIATAKHLITSI